jgi:hypothetical protein
MLPVTPVDQHDVWLGGSDAAWRINDGSLSGGSSTGQAGVRTGEETPMAVRDIYLKIEPIRDYSPVEPDDHVSPPIKYRRDCMRNMGHEDGVISPAEVAARRLTALIYREYLDPQYLVPKPDKLVAADVNEPAFTRRVPGTVLYARPGDWLRIHVRNADVSPHSFHLHGVRYGIDSDGSWPFGSQSDDGRRSDEICPGQTWTYSFQVTEDTVGAWPFHDHCRDIGANLNRGLFGGLVVLPEDEHGQLPRFPFPRDFLAHLQEVLEHLPGRHAAGQDQHGEQQGDAGVHGGIAHRGPAAAAMAMPVPGVRPAPGGGAVPETPPELLRFLVTLDELAHAPQPLPPREHRLHVPLFLHQMSGSRESPVFQSAPLNPGGAYTSPPLTIAGTYAYICGLHGVDDRLGERGAGCVQHRIRHDRRLLVQPAGGCRGDRWTGHLVQRRPQPAQRRRAGR